MGKTVGSGLQARSLLRVIPQLPKLTQGQMAHVLWQVLDESLESTDEGLGISADIAGHSSFAYAWARTRTKAAGETICTPSYSHSESMWLSPVTR